MNFPLHIIAWISLIVAIACSAIISLDILLGRRQPMWIMNVVWPITALYAGPLALFAYFAIGRSAAGRGMHHGHHDSGNHGGKSRPFWQTTALATTHCGAGCTLGDLIVEWGALFIALIRMFPFRNPVFNVWFHDFIAAYLLGIVFQYFTIVPMRGLSFGKGIVAAIKADTLSLIAWQVGMYGWMAVVMFVIFRENLRQPIPPSG